MKKKNLLVMLIGMMAVGIITGCGNSKEAIAADPVETVGIVETTKESEPETEAIESEESDKMEESSAEVEAETTEEVESEETEPAKTTEPEEAAESIEEMEEVTEEYTYTETNTVMYAKSSVNVRSMPSTDGERIGGLSTNQEVVVTGTCNETGWKRIEYNGAVGYVADSYLVTEKAEVPAASNNVATTNTSTDTASNASTSSVEKPASMDRYRTGEINLYMSEHTEAELRAFVTDEEWNYLVAKNFLHCTDSAEPMDAYVARITGGEVTTIAPSETTTTPTGTVTSATSLLALVNADRETNGSAPLEWSSSLEATALERATELASDFSHNGFRNAASENIYQGYNEATYANSWWVNSEAHHAARIDGSYTQYAAAVYSVNGTNYWVELFDY